MEKKLFSEELTQSCKEEVNFKHWSSFKLNKTDFQKLRVFLTVVPFLNMLNLCLLYLSSLLLCLGMNMKSIPTQTCRQLTLVSQKSPRLKTKKIMSITTTVLEWLKVFLSHMWMIQSKREMQEGF